MISHYLFYIRIYHRIFKLLAIKKRIKELKKNFFYSMKILGMHQTILSLNQIMDSLFQVMHISFCMEFEYHSNFYQKWFTVLCEFFMVNLPVSIGYFRGFIFRKLRCPCGNSDVFQILTQKWLTVFCVLFMILFMISLSVSIGYFYENFQLLSSL